MRNCILWLLAVLLPASGLLVPTAQAADSHRGAPWYKPFQTRTRPAVERPVADVARGVRPGQLPGRPGRDEGEIMLDTARLPGLPLYSLNSAGVASDSTDFLVAWCPGFPAAVYAVRVSARGQLLDSTPIEVMDDEFANNYADAACDGENYLVVWQMTSWDSIGNVYNDIYGARVTPEGMVLDPDGIQLAATDGTPFVTFGGGNYFVTWLDNLTMNLYGARVTPAGVVLDPDGILIRSDSTLWLGNIDVTSGGAGYLAVWSGSDTLRTETRATRITANGVVLDTVGIVLTRDSLWRDFRAAAFDGANYLVVSSAGEWPEVDVYGTRLSPAGVLLDSVPFAITSAPLGQTACAVTFDGANYLVTWVDGRRADPSGSADVYAARVHPDGTILDPDGFTVDSLCMYPGVHAVAASAGNALAIWDHADYGSDFRAARISPAGTVLDPEGFRLAFGVNQHYRPVTASDGTDYLTIWLDTRRDGIADVYGARVSAAGQVLDDPPFLVGLCSERGWIPPPALGFGGSSYLAVWADFRSGESDLYAARISRLGVVLDTTPINVCTEPGAQMMPAVAFDGTNYLATWTDFRHNPDQPAVYAARVNQSGTVLDPNGFKVVEEPGGQGWPPAAFDGTNYLVTWIEGRNGEDDIYAARVTPAGVVLDSGGFPVSRATGSQWHPQVDFDGTNYFVVWRDMRSGMFDGVYGARVRPDGTVLDTGGLWLSGEYSFSVMPQVRYDGVNLAVVWQDFDVNTYVTNVRGCHVSPDGMVVDTFSVEDLQSFDFMGWLSLAAGDQRQLLATWYDMVGEYQGKSYYNYRALAEVGAFGVGITAPHATEPRLRLAVYPSPCRGRVTIEAAIPNGRSQTRLEVFTSDGRAVRSLALPQPTGSVTWDGTDDAGRAQPAGVYVIRMSGGQMTANRKLLLLR